MVALFLFAVLVTMTLIAPWLNPNDVEHLDWAHVAMPPGAPQSHWFGTDRLGRDLFVRTFEGARISLLIGLIATIVSVGVGV